MNNTLRISLFTLLALHSQSVFGVDDAGILGGTEDATCLTAEKIRVGDIHLDDIPCVINGMINIFMGLAAMIAIVFVIIGAYQILFGSLEGNKTKGKETITMALGGFALAAFSWLIVKFILDNFT